jgi:transcriptional regulator with XRE-family HTH domain
MTGGNVIFMARRRAHMSQRELASRLGCRQATIARWERGDRQPSYEDVRDVADACGLQLDAHLLAEDRSWWPQIAMQLERTPSERVRRVTPAHADDAVVVLELLARVGRPVIVIGEVAGALHGWPLVLGPGVVEVCAQPDAVHDLLGDLHVHQLSGGAYELPSGGRLIVTELPPGTTGYRDLVRGVQRVDLDGARVQVADLLDLLRIADASSDPDSRRHALACQAVLDVHRAQRKAGFVPDPGDENKILQWLAHQTPAA